MKMMNPEGEALYYNAVDKGGKIQYVMKGIGDTMIIGRDKQKKEIPHFHTGGAGRGIPPATRLQMRLIPLPAHGPRAALCAGFLLALAHVSLASGRPPFFFWKKATFSSRGRKFTPPEHLSRHGGAVGAREGKTKGGRFHSARLIHFADALAFQHS